MNWWDGTTEEINEHFRQQWLREDQMLAFHDQVGGQMTKKALAAKFNLKPTRVSLLIRRRDDARERASMLAKIERLEELRAKSSTFTSIAERLWMDLGWLAMELERRKIRGLV